MNIIAVFLEKHKPGPYVIGEALEHCLGTCAYKGGTACVIKPSALLQKVKLEEMHLISIATDPLNQTFLITFVYSLLCPAFIK